MYILFSYIVFFRIFPTVSQFSFFRSGHLACFCPTAHTFFLFRSGYSTCFCPTALAFFLFRSGNLTRFCPTALAFFLFRSGNLACFCPTVLALFLFQSGYSTCLCPTALAFFSLPVGLATNIRPLNHQIIIHTNPPVVSLTIFCRESCNLIWLSSPIMDSLLRIPSSTSCSMVLPKMLVSQMLPSALSASSI